MLLLQRRRITRTDDAWSDRTGQAGVVARFLPRLLCYHPRRSPGGVAQSGRAPPSHGGSQGFKSPHLHPTTALVTGLAGCSRRAGVQVEPLPGQQMSSNHERYGQPLIQARPILNLMPRFL
jgi:hypothetical protein